ncbi:unnamed protein product [Ilex paraguariensis]|uniref:Uncharacterized protein n=1 Tax=Ilex paraguariensis TaxID=185542 RepID=A0ABC8UTS6_9AQUA
MVVRFILVLDPDMGIPVRKATQSYEPGRHTPKRPSMRLGLRLRSPVSLSGVGVQCTALTRKANKKLSQIGGTRSKRMHWMDARALRRKDAFRGERPWGDTVCDPWISDREIVSKLHG